MATKIKRIICDLTTGNFFHSYNGPGQLKFVDKLRRAAKYSQSNNDSTAIEYILSQLNHYYPTHQFEVQTFSIEETWTKINTKN